MGKRHVNTTLNSDLYKAVKLLSIELDKNANELLDEGMKLVLKKHRDRLENIDPGINFDELN